MKMSVFRFAFLALIVVTAVYVEAFADAWYRVEGIKWRNIYAVGTILFFMWYGVALYSAVKRNQSEGMKLKSKLTRLRKVAVILAVIGGGSSAVCGGVMWLGHWGWFPWLGLGGFVLGTLIILGGILIIRGRDLVGGNLAIWCGVANIFSGGTWVTLEAAFIVLRVIGLTGPIEAIAAFVFGLTLSVIFPILSGVLGIISGRNQNETNH